MRGGRCISLSQMRGGCKVTGSCQVREGCQVSGGCRQVSGSWRMPSG